jgi:hypothetical protein
MRYMKYRNQKAFYWSIRMNKFVHESKIKLSLFNSVCKNLEKFDPYKFKLAVVSNFLIFWSNIMKNLCASSEICVSPFRMFCFLSVWICMDQIFPNFYIQNWTVIIWFLNHGQTSSCHLWTNIHVNLFYFLIFWSNIMKNLCASSEICVSPFRMFCFLSVSYKDSYHGQTSSCHLWTNIHVNLFLTKSCWSIVQWALPNLEKHTYRNLKCRKQRHIGSR